MSIFVTEIRTEIGMKIDRGCFTQMIITTEIVTACFMVTILLMISVVDFLNWNRQSMIDDVDYRVRVTKIDSHINIIGLSCMLSGLPGTVLLLTWCMSRTSKKHAKRLVFFIFNLWIQWSKNYSNRMYCFVQASRTQHITASIKCSAQHQETGEPRKPGGLRSCI